MTDELEGLSDEERAALADEEDETTKEVEEEDDEQGEEKAPENAVEPQAAEPLAAEAKPEPVVEKEFIPQWKPAPVEDFETKMAEIDARKRELRAQYREGDIDIDTYEEQREAVDGEALALREAQFKAQIAEEQQQQVQQQRWQWEIERFLAQPANAQYRTDAQNSRNSELDAVVRVLGQDPKNSEKPMTWFLEEADRWVRARYGETEKPADKPKPKTKAPIPPSLANLPAADLADVEGDDEFAKLDRVEDGMELERMLSKMSEAEQARYLRGH